MLARTVGRQLVGSGHGDTHQNQWDRQADLFHCDMDAAPGTFEPGGEFDEVKWWQLDADTINRVPSGGVRLIGETVKKLMETGRTEKSLAEKLLAAT